MKTKIRIQQTQNGNYKHLFFQILIQRWKDSDALEPIGLIHWQCNVGEDRWYGMSFQIDTDKVIHIEQMAKLGKFININSTNRDNPKEIFNLIGGEEHTMFHGYFIPQHYVGMFMYDVIINDKVYTRIFAANEIMAQKIVKKKKLNDAKVEVVCVVELASPSYASKL